MSIANARLTELVELGIFNVQEALERLDGNKSLYLKLLNYFVIYTGDFETIINTALASNDRETMAFYAHDMKGLAATVGADIISCRANEFEIAIQERNEDALTLTHGFLQLINNQVRLLQSIFSNKKTG